MSLYLFLLSQYNFMKNYDKEWYGMYLHLVIKILHTSVIPCCITVTITTLLTSIKKKTDIMLTLSLQLRLLQQAFI